MLAVNIAIESQRTYSLCIYFAARFYYASAIYNSLYLLKIIKERARIFDNPPIDIAASITANKIPSRIIARYRIAAEIFSARLPPEILGSRLPFKGCIHDTNIRYPSPLRMQECPLECTIPHTASENESKRTFGGRVRILDIDRRTRGRR